MSSEPAHQPIGSPRPLTIDDLAAAQNVKPMASAEEWAADIFESDDELEAFLADVRSSRNASLA